MKFDLKTLPALPGVYLMKDVSGDVIYVGKAKSLDKRVRQYFQSKRNLSPKTVTLVKHIDDIEYIITDSEVDALILEANLIKKYKPRYNVRLKDDKRYPYVKVTINSEFPRIFLTRRRLMDGAIYFGPYTNAKAIRTTLDIISRIFMLRQCKKKIEPGKTRPCLNYHIKRCMAPCKEGLDKEEYRRRVMEAVRLLKGETSGLLKDLDKKMRFFAENQDYESAAIIRDQIDSVKSISEQQIATSGTDDRDVIAAVSDEKAVYIQVFYVRQGSMVGKADFTLLGANTSESIEESMAQFVKQYYQDSPIPPEILVQYELPDSEIIVKWLCQRSGRDVRVHVPQRGDKKKLVEMAARNAEMSKRMAGLKSTPSESAIGALEALKDVLHLETLPLHIEGFDISNISGTNAVGSMVYFENGRPASSKYRQHNIKTVKGIDDFAMMAEVVHRRYSRLLKNKEPLPDLILIDGGPGQVGAAKSSLDSLGLDIPMIGLAKRFEHIITTKKGPDEVIILPHSSSALKLLMHIRDEAHRFAVSSHRRRRSASLTHSELDSIPGVGSSRKKVLLENFDSIDKIRMSSVEELSSLDGISKNLARKILQHLNK
ncbi:MAG: excinuclease subunit [Methanolobus sp.]|jgi:excinuclease ABC subunit C|uniref:excinuclease ABC subunit UvrC n=1 Tax=Methanolobus sp. TaxID=1874737 RepID=UPI0024AB942F|nr:excinuclease ABC subunit UvrC [Methanolobus sp.]MDI3485400.1 excinuclease subunit [Methanolobus sp.]MDK2832063.1 excinuclease subunit [Methanolobus sp.]MDK2938748.1 excinuclease subunit [Methanolobus sp.]